ncbi:transcription antitermination factor NusB [uncultured Paludibaculum sp.]|uniref:transcription antitermination factor NusB n=1 Tax=uncultured Paludibaculum sp. TaxID=1765020 RepID=UPI002AAABE82|nr:transcription antitermination factor NusB [uncultured Paludibaculum sp.]
MTPARRIAFEILGAVDRGGFAADLLDERTVRLDARDAGLVTQIVFGVLRRRAQLDFLITQAASRPVSKMDSSVVRALRMGVFQLRFLSKIPPHAAVGESVDLVKMAGKQSAAGFCNAVLRRLPEVPAEWPSDEVRYSMPEWLWARWRMNLGGAAAVLAADAALNEPETWFRTPDGETVADAAPEGSRVMDIGSQSIVPLLQLERGQWFLDVCAAPGNKTAQALEAGVRAVACDLSAARLKALLVECPRVLLDGEKPLPFGRVFDRILVDAPCSGTGTLGRNPEIRWRLTPDEIPRQAERQKRILRNALACLKPGGRLVYSTCSLEPEENKEVVNRVAAARVQRLVQRLPGRDPGDGFFAAVLVQPES